MRRKPGWEIGRFEAAPVCEWCHVALYAPAPHGAARHDDRTRDHVIPRGRGGMDVQDNVVAACRLCNNLRGHMPAEEFRAIARAHIEPHRYDLDALSDHLASAGFGRWAATIRRL